MAELSALHRRMIDDMAVRNLVPLFQRVAKHVDMAGELTL